MNNKLAGYLSAAVITASAFATTAQADVPITIHAGVGQWLFDGDRDLDNSGTPWIALEYAITDQWAAEIFYADDETDVEGSGGPDVDVTTWQLDLLYYGKSYIGEGFRASPYLVGGAGEIDFDAGSFDSVETTLNAGGGIRTMFTDRIGARLEARMLYSLDENETDFLIMAGLNYYFGDVAKPAAPAPAAPLDTDGDGVIDANDQCPGTAPGTRVDAVGCPIPVTQVASIKLKVNFGFDSAKVQERYFSDLAELAAFLNRFEDLNVDVEGHTDNVGPASYNKQLSQRRAQAVVDYLVSEHGIAASRLDAVGYGEDKPVASNDSSDGRAENRRVMATLEVEYEE